MYLLSLLLCRRCLLPHFETITRPRATTHTNDVEEENVTRHPSSESRDKEQFEMMKRKEIANGRLAMLAVLGYVSQYASTGKSPLTNLADHVASPWIVNVSQNLSAIPIAGADPIFPFAGF